MRKNYVLDANILLHDPHSVFQFADNTVIIPVGVIGEIDRFKKERTDRGFNARSVVRLLDALRNETSLADGVKLESGGKLVVRCDRERALTEPREPADVEILRVAQATREAEPDTPVVIVTKDINLRIRADAAGLRAEDYTSDRIQLSELYSGQREHVVTPERLAEFREHRRLAVPELELSPNEYVLLRAEGGAPGSALGRADVDSQHVVGLHEAKDTLWGISPSNTEQYFAIDAVLDDKIKLVTLMGKAGTGKTLLALAAAIEQALGRNRYRGVLVARPVFPMGRDIGYLPGDVGQKLEPWMKPIADTIEFLIDAGGAIKGHSDCTALVRAGLLEIQPLTYIRGRSISNRFVVIDEAQNLTPLEVKTVITRVGRAAKVVLTGDPYQIDNPYVDANSNGFTFLVNRFRPQAVASHVELRKGERSPLAELAANLL
jgi:PhoH-like ATPase